MVAIAKEAIYFSIEGASEKVLGPIRERVPWRVYNKNYNFYLHIIFSDLAPLGKVAWWRHDS